MARYNVRVPYTGYVEIEVSAKTEDEAKEIAFDLADIDRDDGECEFHFCVTNGNVFHGLLDKIDVEEIEEEDWCTDGNRKRSIESNKKRNIKFS